LDDAQAILGYLHDHRRVVIIGGGLLGLEIARAIRSQGAEVEVVEFFDRLLPRQLDVEGASLLRGQIESLGIRVRLGVTPEEALGPDEVRGIRLKGGAEISAGMAVVAAGVRPNLDLPRAAGLATDRGLVVDDRLRTSHPRVFAAGDSVQHRGKVYGIIPASFDQARAAAYNMLGQDKKYEGTIPANTLKVVGLYVTSVGNVFGEGPGFESVVRSDPGTGLYKKIVLQEGRLAGAIWMGTKTGASEIGRLVALRKDVERRKEDLLGETFDFGELL
jgi:nitrite reductase (NADH) large subunit